MASSRWLAAALVLGFGAMGRAAAPLSEGLVTLSFDDGWQTQYTHALPLLRAHERRAVFFLTTLALAEGWRGFLSVDEARELWREGHELGSHSVDHPDLRAVTAAELERQLAESQAWLVATFGESAGRHFAAPFGYFDETVLSAVRRHYDSCRSVHDGRNFADVDPFALASYDVHRRIGVAEVEGWLAAARLERSWIILTFHELVDGVPARDTELDVAELARILDAVDASGLRVVTLSEGLAELGAAGEDQERDRAGGCSAAARPPFAALLGLAALFWRRRAAGARGAAGPALALLLLASCADDDEERVDARLTPASPSREAPRRGAPPPPMAAAPAPSPALRLVGRFDERDPARPLAAWPGTRILARFSGERVGVRLEEIERLWQEGGPSELDVAIDGVWRDKLVLTPGEADYLLAEGLGPGEHALELYKRSEAQNGVTRLVGLELGGGHLLAPPPAATRRLEIIGDSASTGFGVEGVGLGPNCPGPDWAARYQSFRLAWGARLGERLGAEVFGTVYSGKGIVRNIWREDTVTLPMLYGRGDPHDRESVVASPPLDAIFVMIGGNDFNDGLPEDDGPLPVPLFAAALADFLARLRAEQPAADLVLVVSPSTPERSGSGRALRADVRAGLLAARSARLDAGEARLHLVEPRVAEADELRGCNGHGTPAFHDRVAAELEAFARDELAWP